MKLKNALILVAESTVAHAAVASWIMGINIEPSVLGIPLTVVVSIYYITHTLCWVDSDQTTAMGILFFDFLTLFFWLITLGEPPAVYASLGTLAFGWVASVLVAYSEVARK